MPAGVASWTHTKSHNTSEIHSEACLKIIYRNNDDYSLNLSTSGLHNLFERRNDIYQQPLSEIQIPSHRLHHVLPPPQNFISTRNLKKYDLVKCCTNCYKDSFVLYCQSIFSDFVICLLCKYVPILK